MFYNFNSMMERDLVLKKIREAHIFPEKWVKIAPQNIFNLVKILTEREPSKRWSSYEILNSNLLPFYFSEDLVNENFKKIIDENKKYISKFIDILIHKNYSSGSVQIEDDRNKDSYIFVVD